MDVFKAGRSGLTPLQKQVTRQGKTFTQTFYVKTNKDKKQGNSKPTGTQEKSRNTTSKQSKFDINKFNSLKSNKSQALSYLKECGVTWKENKHEGINWMHAMMEVKKLNPEYFSSSAKTNKKQDTGKNKVKNSNNSVNKTREYANKQIDNLVKEHGKNNVMSMFKKQGITWKEDAHEGINWMRFRMELRKQLEQNKISVDSKSEDYKSVKEIILNRLDSVHTLNEIAGWVDYGRDYEKEVRTAIGDALADYDTEQFKKDKYSDFEMSDSDVDDMVKEFMKKYPKEKLLKEYLKPRNLPKSKPKNEPKHESKNLTWKSTIIPCLKKDGSIKNVSGSSYNGLGVAKVEDMYHIIHINSGVSIGSYSKRYQARAFAEQASDVTDFSNMTDLNNVNKEELQKLREKYTNILYNPEDYKPKPKEDTQKDKIVGETGGWIYQDYNITRKDGSKAVRKGLVKDGWAIEHRDDAYKITHVNSGVLIISAKNISSAKKVVKELNNIFKENYDKDKMFKIGKENMEYLKDLQIKYS